MAVLPDEGQELRSSLEGGLQHMFEPLRVLLVDSLPQNVLLFADLEGATEHVLLHHGALHASARHLYKQPCCSVDL